MNSFKLSFIDLVNVK